MFNLNAAGYGSSWSSPGSFICAEEELGSVGVGTSISHGQYTPSGMLQREVLIRKPLPIDRFASSAIVVGKVSTLNKKNVPVESAMW